MDKNVLNALGIEADLNGETEKRDTPSENKSKHKGYIIIANIFCAFLIVFGSIGAIGIGVNSNFVIGLSTLLGVISLWLLLQGIVNIVENTEK